MILWLDAQMPPSLAPWLRQTFGIDVFAVRTLGLRDATDTAIFAAARAAQSVIVSKDQDFVELIRRLGAPPQLLWVTCGNVSNSRMQTVFASAWPHVLTLLEQGDSIIEIADLDAKATE